MLKKRSFAETLKDIIPAPQLTMQEQLCNAARDWLLKTIPPAEIERVLKQEICDIDPEFLGFVGQYQMLSRMIPQHFTVIDLGCAYSPQAYFFQNHARYIGIDLMDGERFKTDNSEHHSSDISAWIEANKTDFDMDTTFAICSYVPSWGHDNIKKVKDTFKNVFTFYPAELKPVLKKAKAVSKHADTVTELNQ